MSTSVFDHDHSFSYLSKRLSPPEGPRGAKARFAEHLRIKPAYLSQVLAKKVALSPEHADLANSYFNHSVEEADFFLLLVNRDRSGSQSLRRHYDRQVRSILQKRLEVTERLGRKGELSAVAQGVYYSSWIFAALHVATTIPALRTPQALRERFGLSAETVARTMKFLEENALVERRGDGFHPTQSWVRLARTSPLITPLHTNWRQAAIRNIPVQEDSDFHFSGIYTLDAKTAEVIREALLTSVREQVLKIETAPEREIFALGVDFFRLKR